MRKARKLLVGLVATLLLAALVVPAGSAIGSADGSGSPVAAEAKKKCKKKKKKKCKKRGVGYFQGRYSGTYAENNVNLFFNVLGGRIYTGPFDAFYIDAVCSDGSTDPSAIEPVQAFIAANGSFSGSGNYTPGFGQVIPWRLSGQIAGRFISGGVFTVGPYNDFSGNVCSGTTRFTAEWFGAYIL